MNMAKQSGPDEKANDHLWKWFCNEKWQEHQKEVEAWEGQLPTYTEAEYVAKNKDFLLEQWLETFWPGYILVKPENRTE